MNTLHNTKTSTNNSFEPDIETNLQNASLEDGNHQTVNMPMLKPAILLFLVLSLILGLCYPLFITGIGQTVLNDKANGSMIEKEGKLVGSNLIGQSFDQDQYLWPRPSAAGKGYDAAQSSGSNLGPLNPELVKNVEAQVEKLKASDPGNTKPIPQDLVTSSASGLDPQISPAAAEWQINRIARARGISTEQVQQIINANTEGRQLSLFGEPRVNVLGVNLALDKLAQTQNSKP
ncbi:potassium-transporting ATPase subunit KdpC [Psychrobacter sp.]|uniref:potassium-transporting ATPase subunit KdpC n=1 Tax=Psychrobacter sp. TaxID=56811 RepID=UPI0025DFF477|nr:potassium-transporting ATPase subunit KdpC [Psychrobacter sp.]